MSIKVFQINEKGKVEFTRCELEKLLNETYNEGYHNGENHAKSNYWTWNSPMTSPTLPICYTADSAIPSISNLSCEDSSAKVTTAANDEDSKTYAFNASGNIPNLNVLTETIDSILSGAFDPKTFKAAAAIQPKNDAFTNLAKELRGL